MKHVVSFPFLKMQTDFLLKYNLRFDSEQLKVSKAWKSMRP